MLLFVSVLQLTPLDNAFHNPGHCEHAISFLLPLRACNFQGFRTNGSRFRRCGCANWRCPYFWVSHCQLAWGLARSQCSNFLLRQRVLSCSSWPKFSSLSALPHHLLHLQLHGAVLARHFEQALAPVQDLEVPIHRVRAPRYDGTSAASHHHHQGATSADPRAGQRSRRGVWQRASAAWRSRLRWSRTRWLHCLAGIQTRRCSWHSRPCPWSAIHRPAILFHA